MSASTTWACDRCGKSVEIPGCGVPAPEKWIPIKSIRETLPPPGSWRDDREINEQIACSPACAEALAHDAVTAAFAAGSVSSFVASCIVPPQGRS